MSLVDIGIYVGRSRILHGQVSDLSGDLNRESCVVWGEKGARAAFCSIGHDTSRLFRPTTVRRAAALSRPKPCCGAVILHGRIVTSASASTVRRAHFPY